MKEVFVRSGFFPCRKGEFFQRCRRSINSKILIDSNKEVNNTIEFELSSVRLCDSGCAFHDEINSFGRPFRQSYKFIVDYYESVDNILWTAIFQNSQHNSIDDFDEILNLVLNASADQVLMNCSLVLIFINQLSESEVDTKLKQFYVNVPDYVLESDTPLE